MPSALHGLPSFQPKSRKEWRAWLKKHHTTSPGVWLVYAKKHTGIPTLTYDESVEEALCFGWIDSLRHPVDDTLWKMVFTPRKPKSRWSAPNKKRVEAMVAAGLMTAAGMAMVAIAKKNGTWDALSQVETLQAPDDLAKAVSANRAAKKNWPDYPANIKKLFLLRLTDAKRPETRAKRIVAIVDIIARNLTMKDLREGKVVLP
jgi:uncharacterized protein YdeI (YjbR/CyaY-like superfamily)